MRAMKKNARALLSIGAGCLLLVGGVAGYRYLFTSGLEQLPQKVCSGAVDREIVIRALPPSRSAEEGDRSGSPGQHFFFSCYVYAGDDSTLSGEAQAADSSVTTWVKFYEGKRGGDELVRIKKGPVQALSLPDGLVSVHVPCTPQRHDSDEAVQSYALVTEARTIGETRAEGDDLRQAVTDFAYAITKHAYRSGGCQERISLPTDLSDANPRSRNE
ncbi:hypothetical protein ACFV28_29040 [Streptomyces sp. NPDC059720]|uniref:hypothetical protein n=1 Tax=Streptomyces sp. NPDC059720 TaxID=3346924 RepID=UPI00367D445C